jgi:hypothetical protein
MHWPSSKADVLRAVGYVLDSDESELSRVEEDDLYLTIRLLRKGVSAEVSYSSADLQALLTEARGRRGKSARHSRLGFQEKLRVVGQQLDRKFARSIRVEHRGGSFTVTFLGRDPGRTRVVLTASVMEDLVDLAPRQRAGHEDRRRLATSPSETKTI